MRQLTLTIIILAGIALFCGGMTMIIEPRAVGPLLTLAGPLLCPGGDVGFAAISESVDSPAEPELSGSGRTVITCERAGQSRPLGLAANGLAFVLATGAWFVLGAGLALLVELSWRRRRRDQTPVAVALSPEEQGRIRAMARGDRLRAINEVRRLTGAGLAAADHYVTALLAGDDLS